MIELVGGETLSDKGTNRQKKCVDNAICWDTVKHSD